MSQPNDLPLHGLDENAAVRTILEGTAQETGQRFFAALVESLARALATRGAWITEYLPEARRLRSLAFWMEGRWIPDYEYAVAGTPCEVVVAQARLVHYPDKVLSLFPEDRDLADAGAVSYMGAPLLDAENRVLGHLAVLDTRPLPAEPRYQALIRMFATRASAELQRLRAEAGVRERETQLAALFDTAMDAILQLDEEFRVVRANPSARKAYRCGPGDIIGRRFTGLLTGESADRLRSVAGGLDPSEERTHYLWIPGNLRATRPGGGSFTAEATLSRFELEGRTYFTVILRNVDERLEAERKIRSLSAEATYLREELRVLRGSGEILGESEALVEVLRDMEQVAGTDSTVLILGETGTGKELVARAIHAGSRRHDGPLVKVNCAAIPAHLIESEFFGHEKGAFTGATGARTGRFALAGGGTIFLDEVGELPLDLQTKLLRVLQEGEFEPVGSSRPCKVDARVIAATNRDLQAAVKAGSFRGDLYYRLAVFPIRLPPLRERGDDVVILAEAFARKLGERMGKSVGPLPSECVERLKSYSWPGNVRELHNVLERAVILSRNGRLDLDRALPQGAAPAAGPQTGPATGPSSRILSVQELERLERENLLRALESTGWKVAGKGGAAERLGIHPSTLSSKLRSLGIRRPSRES